MNALLRRFSRPFKTQLDMQRFAPLPAEGYLVGGALRDALLGRDSSDLDWVVTEPEEAARAAAEALGGSVFPLDTVRGHWRVVVGDSVGDSVRDYAPLNESLEENLRARDYTVNALAADAEGNIVDPTGGRADLRRKRLRMVSRENLENDPLRPLRGVRLSITLGFRLEPVTEAAIKEQAQKQARGLVQLPAQERVYEELNKLISHPGGALGFKTLHDLGLLGVYLPELEACANVEQGGYHHLDVLGHSLEALHALNKAFPDASLTARWGTLLHDIGKPPTKTYDESGRYYHFYGHDKLGADMAAAALTRLRASGERLEMVSKLVRYHMLPLPQNEREARRFVHKRRDLLPDLLRVMVSDREAARGRLSTPASRNAYRMGVSRVLAALETPPPNKPLLDGREVMTALKLTPGAQVGEALRFVQEAHAVGDVTTKEEALEALRHYAQAQGWEGLS